MICWAVSAWEADNRLTAQRNKARRGNLPGFFCDNIRISRADSRTDRYTLNQGLDLIARFNGKYVIGEAKFLTDFGGHQNAQFNDGIAPLQLDGLNAIPVAILDGVLYIRGNGKMHTAITTEFQDKNIMSSLVLREFLYQL